jgi:nitrate reductase assembly molybdenum cofactor insertion protein NarJ
MPDHLPVLLEFLSVCSGDTARWIASTYRDSVAVLAHRLGESASPYACLIDLTLSLFDWLQVPEQEAIWTGT